MTRSDSEPQQIGVDVRRIVRGLFAPTRARAAARGEKRQEIQDAEERARWGAVRQFLVDRRSHLAACGVADTSILDAICGDAPLRRTPALVALEEWLDGRREYPLGSGSRWGPAQRPFLNLCCRGTGEGAYGTGKSLAGAVFLLQAVREVRTLAHPLSEEPVVLTVLDHRLGLRVTAEQLRYCSRFEDDPRKEALLDRASRVPYLLLDELRPPDADETGRARLEPVLSARYERGLPTVITSNAGNELFRRLLGDRLTSRMKSHGVTVDCRGPDLRGEKR